MDAITLSLPQSLDISLVNEIKKTMLDQITSDTPSEHIIINAQELTRVDTAGLQLLTAFVLEVSKQNINFSWEEVPSELIDNARLLDLHNVLKFN